MKFTLLRAPIAGEAVAGALHNVNRCTCVRVTEGES